MVAGLKRHDERVGLVKESLLPRVLDCDYFRVRGAGPCVRAEGEHGAFPIKECSSDGRVGCRSPPEAERFFYAGEQGLGFGRGHRL
jgi:hypothetical protein